MRVSSMRAARKGLAAASPCGPVHTSSWTMAKLRVSHSTNTQTSAPPMRRYTARRLIRSPLLHSRTSSLGLGPEHALPLPGERLDFRRRRDAMRVCRRLPRCDQASAIALRRVLYTRLDLRQAVGLRVAAGELHSVT